VSRVGVEAASHTCRRLLPGR